MRAEILFENLVEKVKDEKFSSYDPYDGSNSRFGLLNNFYCSRVFLTYFNKFSPVNFRPVLGIPKSRQIQCLAFIGLALMNYNREKYKSVISEIAEEIMDSSLIGDFNYHCWEAHGFPIQMRKSNRLPGLPDVVGDEACGRLLLGYSKLTKNKKGIEQALSFRNFLIDTFFTNYSNSDFFKYTPADSDYKCTYNASTFAAAYILEINEHIGSATGNDLAKRAFKYVVSKQKSDGSWNYSINLDTGFEKKQIDFHQGFILDTLLSAMKIWPDEIWLRDSYIKGLQFYHKYQFSNDGRGYYRLPKKWPVNIHNQSQGIITFTKAADAGFGEEYREFAQTILSWTVNNMMGKDGRFYYLKYPFFTNKIPYMRWSDANMLYALSILIKNNKTL